MKTAAYTICKNEINRVEQWLYYTRNFDYRVVLDTGSTDGTYEALKKADVILDQHIVPFEEFRFDIPRNINLNMIPRDVDWCLSPDMDEYFSINVLDVINQTEQIYPNVTNIACTRLDIYSDKVFVGRPNSIGTNKVHRRHDYDWKQPIYEHLSFVGEGNELEIYSDNLFLIHDQEIDKPRSTLYPILMKREYVNNFKNEWNNWFLANHYYIERDLKNFVEVAINFVKYSVDKTEKYKELLYNLTMISNATNVEDSIKQKIRDSLALK
jgi:hypothetical protein